jgi:hypothetical protein
MSSAIRRQADYWPEHEGPKGPELHAVPRSASGSGLWNLFFGVKTETRVGSLVAAAGLIMAAKTGTMQVSRLADLTFPPGPLEICAIGLLIWLHAKWRHATRVDG